ncbi:MAG: hypothetical protein D4R38_00055 [Dehalococcoidia bacterium]|nr:MAG: hypothetical protein D4R38_00055 [Dehalococcoidia bacterium]
MALSAVQMRDGRAMLELASEEWVFQLIKEQSGHDVPIRFHVKPYLASEMKRMLNATGVVMKTDGGANLLMLPGNRDACLPVFKHNFLRMGNITKQDGSEPSIEEQVKFIEARGWQADIVLSTYGGFSLVPKADASESAGFIFLMVEPESRVDLLVKLWCEETGAVEEVTCQHRLRPASAQQRFDYTHATAGRQLNSRKGEVRSQEDYDAIEKLYDGMILGVEGALIEGQPCASDNGETWIPKVPFWHKSVVIDETFRRDSLKNA